MKKNLVIYHKNCFDGFAAAWSSWKKFGSKAEYYAASHQSFPPSNIKNRNVYMLDYQYPAGHMKNILTQASKVVVIDHHISQKETSKISTENIFEINNSGAVLAWKYFFPDKKIPKLFLYIEDKDIWKFSLKGTEEYMSFLETINFDFKAWDALVKDFESVKKRKLFYSKGESILSFNKKSVETLTSSAEWVLFNKKKCLAVNSPVFVSEIGHILALKSKGVGIVWHKKSGKLKISLRSNNKNDVSKIAAKYGGGGHKSAASFMVNQPQKSLLKFPWKFIDGK